MSNRKDCNNYEIEILTNKSKSILEEKMAKESIYLKRMINII